MISCLYTPIATIYVTSSYSQISAAARVSACPATHMNCAMSPGHHLCHSSLLVKNALSQSDSIFPRKSSRHRDAPWWQRTRAAGVSCKASDNDISVDSLRQRISLPKDGPMEPRCKLAASRRTDPSVSNKEAVSNKLELWPSGRGLEERDTIAVTQNMPADELQARYGGDGISFVAGAGRRVATLRLANGSTTRVVMEGARVTSWQMMMWHGASEEMLCAGVNPTGALEGGICTRIAVSAGSSAELAGQDPELAADSAGEMAAEPWGLLEASWDDARTWARVVLGLEVDAGALPGSCSESDGGDRPISARMVVHLAASALTCVVGFRNLHFKPVTLAPSIDARIAISTPKGVNLNGLQGSLRSRLPPLGGLAGGSADRDDDVAAEGEVPAEDMWPRALANMFGWRGPEVTVPRRPAGNRESALAKTPLAKGGLESSWVIEERDEVHGPLSRIHRGLPGDVLMVDRGKRRSLSLTSSGMDTVVFRTSDSTRERSQDEEDYVHVTFEGTPVGVTLGFEEEWVGTVVLGNRNI